MSGPRADGISTQGCPPASLRGLCCSCHFSPDAYPGLATWHTGLFLLAPVPDSRAGPPVGVDLPFRGLCPCLHLPASWARFLLCRMGQTVLGSAHPVDGGAGGTPSLTPKVETVLPLGSAPSVSSREPRPLTTQDGWGHGWGKAVRVINVKLGLALPRRHPPQQTLLTLPAMGLQMPVLASQRFSLKSISASGRF